jgi:para-aminobenzoate synthetase component 1
MTQKRHTYSCAVPLHTCALAGQSPEVVFASIADNPALFWLDNASPSKSDAWSYLGISPTQSIQIFPEQSFAGSTSVGQQYSISPISDSVESIQIESTPPDELVPPFRSGWVGILGYDISLKDQKTSVRRPPKISLHFFETYFAYSHSTQKWWIVALVSATTPEEAQCELARRENSFVTQFASAKITGSFEDTLPPRNAFSDLTNSEYEETVRRALDYIRAGDIYQVNLSQRLTVPWEFSAAELYLRLRRATPSQFGAYFGSGLLGSDFALCSVSPELFLRRRGPSLLTRPIKGTRPRTGTADSDARARSELSQNAKERAELNMIVDLERNDLGRVCEYNSVRVVSNGEIEELPTLFHRVATIEGRIRADCSLAELLEATFPGGSVTGAPKIRAMQIIEELEHSPRGPYCGAIGWIGLNGDLELSIAIRTALYDGAAKQVHYHAGSGIVADSDPRQEYEETLHKAAAFLRATNATLIQP